MRTSKRELPQQVPLLLATERGTHIAQHPVCRFNVIRVWVLVANAQDGGPGEQERPRAKALQERRQHAELPLFIGKHPVVHAHPAQAPHFQHLGCTFAFAQTLVTLTSRSVVTGARVLHSKSPTCAQPGMHLPYCFTGRSERQSHLAGDASEQSHRLAHAYRCVHNSCSTSCTHCSTLSWAVKGATPSARLLSAH